MTDISIQSLYGAEYAPQRRAVLLVNLGSPRSPEVSDVRDYLTEFLMDEHVISLSYFFRSLLVKGIIAPRRAPYSAQNYKTIWDDEAKCFPLIQHTARIALGLSETMRLPVAMGMRYGAPSVAEALEELSALEGVEEVVLVPLYPHYTRSTFLTAEEYVCREAKRLGVNYRFRCITAFYAHAGYRQVLADSIRPYLDEPFDKLIVSLHGIPLSHLTKPCAEHNGKPTYCYDRLHSHSPEEASECYRLHCESTAQYLIADLGLPEHKVELVYQSRLGWHPWLKPYMKGRVQEWAAEGSKRLLVVCPGFICDCLETYYEIDEEYHTEFLASGGETFRYIPCLNSSPEFIRTLVDIIG